MRNRLWCCMVVSSALVAGGLAVAPVCANASELYTPLLPGVLTGTPLGALPPPGWYLSSSFFSISGSIDNARGKETGIKGQLWNANFVLLWSSPFRIFGARYGASIVQVVRLDRIVDLSGIHGPTTRSNGLYNTKIDPLILSWQISHFHVSVSQNFYLPDGRVILKGSKINPLSPANNYWTWQPNVAVTYLRSGWDATAALSYDAYNSLDRATHYKSGHIAYLDLTLGKRVHGVTVAAVGEVMRQLDADRVSGAAVPGSEAAGDMVGGLVGYRFGSLNVDIKYTRHLWARSGLKVNVVYLTLSGKL